jgi:hypothetical protein
MAKTLKKKSQPRGRKSSSAVYWEKKFIPKLRKLHGNHYRNIFHKIMKKTSKVKSNLKKRSEEYEVVFDLELPEIRHLMYRHYGKPCKYCQGTLVCSNIVFDHSTAISHGGPSVIDNIQIICNRCNVRKGPLSDKDYKKVLKFVLTQEDYVQRYIFKKLASKDIHK